MRLGYEQMHTTVLYTYNNRNKCPEHGLKFTTQAPVHVFHGFEANFLSNS